MKLTQCPLEVLTSDVFDLIRLSELFFKGLPPVAGGVMDQAAMFVTAARFIEGEQNRLKKSSESVNW